MNIKRSINSQSKLIYVFFVLMIMIKPVYAEYYLIHSVPKTIVIKNIGMKNGIKYGIKKFRCVACRPLICTYTFHRHISAQGSGEMKEYDWIGDP